MTDEGNVAELVFMYHKLITIKGVTVVKELGPSVFARGGAFFLSLLAKAGSIYIAHQKRNAS